MNTAVRNILDQIGRLTQEERSELQTTIFESRPKSTWSEVDERQWQAELEDIRLEAATSGVTDEDLIETWLSGRHGTRTE